jgi:hypothetical protein
VTIQLNSGRRIGFGSACLVISLLLTLYHLVLLDFGFFDKALFLMFCGVCLTLLAIAVALLIRVERMLGRMLLVTSFLLSCFWIVGLASLRWTR